MFQVGCVNLSTRRISIPWCTGKLSNDAIGQKPTHPISAPSPQPCAYLEGPIKKDKSDRRSPPPPPGINVLWQRLASLRMKGFLVLSILHLPPSTEILRIPVNTNNSWRLDLNMIHRVSQICTCDGLSCIRDFHDKITFAHMQISYWIPKLWSCAEKSFLWWIIIWKSYF